MMIVWYLAGFITGAAAAAFAAMLRRRKANRGGMERDFEAILKY